VVAPAPGWVEVVRLEHRPYVMDRLLELAIAAPGHERLAGCRLGHAQEQAQRRRLAGAVGAEIAGDRASLEREADLIDRELAVALR
jgi:hypothetical protein